MPAEVDVVPHAGLCCGCIDLAGLHDRFFGQSIILCSIQGETDGCPIGPDKLMILLGLAAVIFRRKIVWQIDHETGVPARRAFANPHGVQHNDPLTRAILAQTPGRSQSCEPRSDHQPFGSDVAVQWLCRSAGAGSRSFQAAGPGSFGQTVDLHGVSARCSARRLQGFPVPGGRYSRAVPRLRLHPALAPRRPPAVPSRGSGRVG